MKRFLAIVLALAMVFALCACGGNDNNKETDKPDTAAYKVAMITDYGDITDQSFNQTTYEACKAFCDKNSVEFKYYKPTADSTAARVEMVEQAVADGFNVIVMPGFAFAGTIAECQDTYPDVKFIGLDISEFDLYDSFYNHDNRFLAGVLAYLLKRAKGVVLQLLEEKQVRTRVAGDTQFREADYFCSLAYSLIDLDEDLLLVVVGICHFHAWHGCAHAYES